MYLYDGECVFKGVCVSVCLRQSMYLYDGECVFKAECVSVCECVFKGVCVSVCECVCSCLTLGTQTLSSLPAHCHTTQVIFSFSERVCVCVCVCASGQRERVLFLFSRLLLFSLSCKVVFIVTPCFFIALSLTVLSLVRRLGQKRLLNDRSEEHTFELQSHLN